VRPQRILTATLVLAAAGCGSKGGSAGGALSTTTAVSGVTSGSNARPGTSGTTAGTLATTPFNASQGFARTWAVTGTDPLRGAFQGTAVTATTAPGQYTVQRLVTFAQKLPTGDQLVWAWNATAHDEAGGLRVDASLRRAHVFRRSGTLTRTAADQIPLALTGLFMPSGAGIAATFSASSTAGPTETWTPSTQTPPVFPVTAVTITPGHAALPATQKLLLFGLFATYHALPVIAPYTQRPEFQAAIHQVVVDTSGLDFLRQQGPGVVLVMDKVVDDIGVAEETRRANAFSRHLYEKAKLFDADMTGLLTDPNGMVVAIDQTVSPPKKEYAQSPVLFTGVWTASQLYRYEATGDPEAFNNLVRGVTGATICVDISPDKTQFARAIDFLANATPGQVGPITGGKYSWAAGTGPYANLMWMLGGNNDMLHGLDMCFSAGAQALPAGHPLRAQIGAQAASLLNNVSIAQSGTHEIHLSYAAWTTTGDPQWQTRYSKALGFKNILDKLYMTIGGNLIQWQGIADWSGQHLGLLDYMGVRLLGGASPNADEQAWRAAGVSGIKAGFGMSGQYRCGLLATIAAAANVPLASGTAQGVLTEFPYPKTTGDNDIDFTVAADFCYSPYPSDPWKADWISNSAARIQNLSSSPMFYKGGDQNYWSRSPLTLGSGADPATQPGQDYLACYWLGRLTGTIGPND
jgi:hypothetical protein